MLLWQTSYHLCHVACVQGNQATEKVLGNQINNECREQCIKKYSCQSFQPVPAVQRDRPEELVVGDLLRGFHESRQGRPPRRPECRQPSPDQTRQLECRAKQQGIFFLFFI